MSVFTINVEVMPGSDIKQCIIEARELAGHLGVSYIKFYHGKIEYWISAHASIKEALDLKASGTDYIIS